MFIFRYLCHIASACGTTGLDRTKSGRLIVETENCSSIAKEPIQACDGVKDGPNSTIKALSACNGKNTGTKTSTQEFAKGRGKGDETKRSAGKVRKALAPTQVRVFLY